MKVNNPQRTKQKVSLKRATQLLAALLFFGVLSTQINFDKEIEGVNNLVPNGSFNNQIDEVENFNQHEVQERPEVVENLVSDNLVVDELETEEALTTNTLAKRMKKVKAIVASPKSITITSSAVAYSSMKMELNNYTGKLSWASSFQRNIKSFAIERSIDDEHYTEIGRIAGEGKGEFTEENFYEFEDTNLMFVQMPSVLYRIKQEGINGDKDYSDLVEYDLGLPEGLYASVEIESNNQLLIHYATTTSSQLSYKVLNTFGNPVSQGNLQGEYEPKSFELKTDTWGKGSFYLQLESGKHSFMEAFVIE